MSLEPGHHRHRAGEDERTAVLHRRTARTEKIRVQFRKEKGEKDLKNPNPNPRRKLGEEQN